MKRARKQSAKGSPVYERIREILESAKANVARSVNTTQVVANWLIGQEIVEEEQRGKRRADYGRRLLEDLSSRLSADFGRGFSINNLEHFRDFYLTYPDLLASGIPHALRDELRDVPDPGAIPHALRGELMTSTSDGDPSLCVVGPEMTATEHWKSATQCVANLGSLAASTQTSRGRTIAYSCESTSLKPEPSTKSKPPKPTGRLAKWSVRSTACFTNGWR